MAEPLAPSPPGGDDPTGPAIDGNVRREPAQHTKSQGGFDDSLLHVFGYALTLRSVRERPDTHLGQGGVGHQDLLTSLAALTSATQPFAVEQARSRELDQQLRPS